MWRTNETNNWLLESINNVNIHFKTNKNEEIAKIKQIRIKIHTILLMQFRKLWQTIKHLYHYIIISKTCGKTEEFLEIYVLRKWNQEN